MKERRQGHGCRPAPFRPTQRLTAPNGSGIVRASMTEKKWLLCQRHIKIQQAAESMAGQRPVSFHALQPSGRKKWVWAPARKKRLAARGKPNALLAPPEGGKSNLNLLLLRVSSGASYCGEVRRSAYLDMESLLIGMEYSPVSFPDHSGGI